MKNKINLYILMSAGCWVKDFSATNKWDLMTNEWGIDKDKKTELHELV